MDEFNLVNYITDCATKLKILQHSDADQRVFKIQSVGNIETLLNELTTVNSPVVLVPVSKDGGLNTPSPSSYLDKAYHHYYILGVTDYGNIDSQEEVESECKLIYDKFTSKMLDDRMMFRNGLKYLQMDITYQSVGPLAGSWYGILVSFTNSKSANIKYNPDDWL